MTATAPDESEVVAALAAFVSTDPRYVDATFEVRERWGRPRSGTVFYRVVASDSGSELILKHGTGWTADTAAELHQAMVRLADVLDDAEIEQTQGLRPIGWTGRPPLLVMPAVSGLDVVSVLRDATHPAWSDDARLLRSWMTRAGRMIAAFHGSGRSTEPQAIRGATSEVGELSRQVRLAERARLRLVAAAERRVVRLFGDFGPGNLLGDENGLLTLLDPPDVAVTGPAHRDLAHFLFETRRQLAGRGYTRTRPIRNRFGDLRAAFLDGYSGAAMAGPLDETDLALVGIYELRRAIGMARKRWPSRPSDAMWFAASALRRRFDLMRAPVGGEEP